MTELQLACLPGRISTGLMGIWELRDALRGVMRRETARRQRLSLNDNMLRHVGLTRADIESDCF